LLPNPPLQLQPLMPEPNVNQHPLPQQPIQVPLGELDSVEILDEPLLVPDYNECDINISNGTTDTIWNFDCVDLALLHKANYNNQQDQQSVISVDDGRLVLQSKKVKKANAIDSIEAWTDAFIVYTHILLAKHRTKAIELLIYMSTIREAAKDTSKEQCYIYDQQFRLRVSRDHTNNGSEIQCY
jgi:hypothetical protein